MTGHQSLGTDHLPGTTFSDYVYGHHKDRASYLASTKEGCALCNRMKPPPLALIGDDNSTLHSRGYFSVFYLKFRQERDPNKPVMMVEARNSRGDFQYVAGQDLVPLGKTPLGIILG